MGTVPVARVHPARFFLQCVIEYAGHFILRDCKGRGNIKYEDYVQLFVCFSKAVYLELASDLLTPAFVAALKRFISQHGKSSDHYSDCDTNFICAANELELFDIVKTQELAVIRCLAEQGMPWHFNAPGAPHQDGLRENRHNWWYKEPNHQSGKMVLVKDEKLPRQQWKLGHSTDAFPGED
ncbi:hypothetical protein PR048_020993 [Dryococelus australis]|uniref:DUF5641 domain-containing protein n=1 Tax=Dryococelus australis TaxID=614101 RepID=A0ABQ9GX16_9NEOP|nr:hypothetical protein PR048_020993 [Dryococelus australis]